MFMSATLEVQKRDENLQPAATLERRRETERIEDRINSLILMRDGVLKPMLVVVLVSVGSWTV